MTPQEAASRYHWCKYNEQTNTIELYLDHYMLSGLRLCEAKFVMEHLLWLKPNFKKLEVPGKVVRKPWFLDFGDYIHWCNEQFYNHFKINKCAPLVDFWIDQCKQKWILMEMDSYADSINESDQKKLEEVHGWEGVAGLLVQYYAFYMDMRLRIIDTEITFGHNKEVKIGEFYLPFRTKKKRKFTTYYEDRMTKIECYLTGRIDLLVDNGYKIGPVDHKTVHKFDGFEHQDFNPHDGLTGYILAIHEILKNYKLDNNNGNLPNCMGGWIYHISACTPSTPRDKTKKQGPRFKTTPIDKTLSQLEDFKSRQLSSFKRVADLVFNGKTPEWNTISCHNIFYRNCDYVPIHEQPSEQWPSIIERFYQISTPWDTRNMSHNKEEKKEEQHAERKAG